MGARRSWFFLGLSSAACLQWMFLRTLGVHPGPHWAAALPGLCIIGAAFLVTWAAEAAEMDLPQSLSIGLVALIAVLPEYAVDIYFAWTAGKNPAYTAYATANMTGANRLLIGVGWPAVLLACGLKHGKWSIHLTERNALELVTLLIATLYAFFLPFKATLSMMDSLVFLAIFGAYGWMSSQAGVEEPELEGTAQWLASLPKRRRRLTIATLFIFSATAIFLAAKPFAEGILAMGRHWGLEEFLLVQWLAPLASEAPEFIVAIVFAIKGKPAVGMRALISSKVNQWTVLVGMIPLAYALSAGHLHPMPLDERQVEEIFLTAAQSLLGIVLLMNLSFTKWEAGSLLILFAAQICFPQAPARYAFAGGHLALSAVLLVTQGYRRNQLRGLVTHVLKSS